MFSELLKKLLRGRSLPSFSADHILSDTTSTTRNQALKFIADSMQAAGYIMSADEFFNALVTREEHGTTGFKDHIATPHAKSKQVKHAGIWVVRFSHEIPWETMDSLPVKTVIALAIPAKSSEAVMMPLIAISRANMQASFREILNHGDRQSIDTAIRDSIGGKL